MARPSKVARTAKTQGTDTDPKHRAKSKTREYAETIVLAILLALFIRAFVVQAFKIPSESMLPTLKVGDHLLVMKFIYGVRLPYINKLIIPISSPQRGDVIVFPFPLNPSTDFIKRVIGIPGDKIEIRNEKLFINDAAVPDTHADWSKCDASVFLNKACNAFGPIVVPPGKLFVMGDNRGNSEDSRFWGFVDIDTVIGKALVIYWSWDNWSVRWGRLGELIE